MTKLSPLGGILHGKPLAPIVQDLMPHWTQGANLSAYKHRLKALVNHE